MEELNVPEHDVFVMSHGCDSNGASQSVMLAHCHPKSRRPTIRHVFDDFSGDRIKVDLQNWLQQMMPREETSEQDRAAIYEGLSDTIVENPGECLDLDTQAWCYRCSQRCKIFESLLPLCTCETGWGHVLHPDAPKDDLPPIIEVWSSQAGTTCVDFTGYGSRTAEGGSNMIDLALWCADVLIGRPLYLFVEIGGNVTIELYAKRLGHIYDFFDEWLHPFRQGIPGRRPRLYGFAWDRSVASFAGSQEEFAALFDCVCTLDASIFFHCPDDARFKVAREEASKRGMFYQEDATSIPPEHRWSALKVARLQEHDATRMALQLPSSQPYCCDLDQNDGHTSCGWLMPPLVTHGCIVDLNKGVNVEDGDGTDDASKSKTYKELLPLEWLLVMGEAIFPETSDEEWRSYITLPIRKLTKSKKGVAEILKLAGNSQVMKNAGTFYFYCVSSLDVHIVLINWSSVSVTEHVFSLLNRPRCSGTRLERFRDQLLVEPMPHLHVRNPVRNATSQQETWAWTSAIWMLI